MSSRRAVYTAVFGGYEALVEQPTARQGDVPFICFTDDASLVSETWDVRVVEPWMPLDPVRSARALKHLGHLSLDEFDETLWIDGSVLLTARPDDVLDAWLSDGDIAIPLHSYRRSVVAEFQEILLMGMDDQTRVYEQLLHYSIEHPDSLQAQPYWTALIARRPTAAVRAFGRIWHDHVIRYSRRDQLSTRVAEALAGVAVIGIDMDNWTSEWHRWPVSEARSTRLPALRVSESLTPPVGLTGILHREIDELNAAYGHSIAERERLIAELESRLSTIVESRAWRAVSRLRRARALLSAGRRGRN